MADETNAGVTAFVAEVTSMCGLRWDGIAAVNSLDFRLSSSGFRCDFTALLYFVPSATCRHLSYLACICLCNEIIVNHADFVCV